ncbi:MAG: hypothetical protein M1292_01060 [Bacteroidetes bacterium]|nr:hypothetical protein [Bacteroidota bacterium]
MKRLIFLFSTHTSWSRIYYPNQIGSNPIVRYYSKDKGLVEIVLVKLFERIQIHS